MWCNWCDMAKKTMLAQQCGATASTSKMCQAMLCNRWNLGQAHQMAPQYVVQKTSRVDSVSCLGRLWETLRDSRTIFWQFWHTCSTQCPVPTMLSHLQEQINHSQVWRIEHWWRPEQWLPQCSRLRLITNQAVSDSLLMLPPLQGGRAPCSGLHVLMANSNTPLPVEMQVAIAQRGLEKAKPRKVF